MKVLCICPIGIGNYLLCYPAFTHLKKNLPDVTLHLLALRKAIIDLAEGDPLWDRIHLIEPTKKPDYATIFHFIKRLRFQHFQTSISFFPSNTWQYQLLPFLAGIPKRFAFSYKRNKLASLSRLATDHIAVDPSLHDVEQNIAIVSTVTGKSVPSDQPVRFPVLYTEKELMQTGSIISKKNRYIAIHPGSSAEHGMDAKRWAPERFAALADRICRKLGTTALIFGGPDETPLKHSVRDTMRESVQVIDPLSLRLTTALMRQCIMCLCNDSGLMHLAACSGVPTIALFGPTDEKRNGPYGNNHCVIRKPLEGFPIWTADTVGSRKLPAGSSPRHSLDALTVDDAWEKCASFIEQFID
jgi:ADP-heptose:LPS heptosyltransferase